MKTCCHLAALMGAWLLAAVSVFGQVVQPTAYRLQFHLASTPDPLTAAPLAETPDLPVAGLCGQVKALLPSGIVVDPMRIAWNDPANPPSLDCVANVAAFLLANLPAAGSASMAGYLATIVAVGGGTQSPRLLATNAFSTTNGPPPPPPPAGKFVLGQSVTPFAFDASVFVTPNGALVGTQLLSAGVIGLVLDGPMIRTEGTNMLKMWQIDFMSGADGWVWEDRLIGDAGHAPPTGVGVRR